MQIIFARKKPITKMIAAAMTLGIKSRIFVTSDAIGAETFFMPNKSRIPGINSKNTTRNAKSPKKDREHPVSSSAIPNLSVYFSTLSFLRTFTVRLLARPAMIHARRSSRRAMIIAGTTLNNGSPKIKK